MARPEPDLVLLKYQILGNSYLVVPPERNPGLTAWTVGGPLDRDGEPGLRPEVVRRLCAVDRGIGSEGVILGPIDRGDAVPALHIYNQDGTRCNFSGNAIRMVTRSMLDSGRLPADPGTEQPLAVIGVDAAGRRVETPATTLVVGHGDGEAAPVIGARLPAPRLGPAPVGIAPAAVQEAPPDMDAPPVPDAWSTVPALADLPGPAGMTAGWTNVCFVQVGNPHCVVLVDDEAHLPPIGFAGFDAADLRALADAGTAVDRPALGGLFPDGCNLQIACVVPGADRVVLRTWERGGGPTAASGSSSSAAAIAAYARGLVGPRVAVEMPGGTLTIALDGPPTAIAGIALESPVIRIAEMTVAAEGLTAA